MGRALTKLPEVHVVRDRPSDLFVTGLDRIEHIGGGMLRLVLYVNHTATEGVVTRVAADFDIIMPADSLPDAVGKAIIAAGRAVFVRELPEMLVQ